MDKNKTFDSGQIISVEDLFSNDNKIIIPDMQRDYCWGDKKHGEKNNREIVSDFIESLIQSFDEYKIKEDKNYYLTLGMLFAYEKPYKFIHLCDGQQRITTLFLLLGILHRKCKIYSDERLINRLVSEEEQNDDWEPYLRYGIRENTLYFLQDLVKEYFYNSSIFVLEDIIHQDWYNNEYNNDPSIRSIISALKIILEIIDDKKIIIADEIQSFTDFLCSKVKFFYYDMGNREHGEDMFVIINTTGEPLSVSENIKPILLGRINNVKSPDESDDYNKQWEKRENYFWNNKKKDEVTADKGVEDFLLWFLKIQIKKESIALIDEFKKTDKIKNSLQNIQKYFDSLIKLIDYINNDDLGFTMIFNQITDSEKFNNPNTEKDILIALRDFTSTGSDQQQNILLPMLSFMVNISDDKEQCYLFLRRLRKNYFDFIRDSRKKNYIDWRYILQIIENSENRNEVLRYNKKLEQITNLKLPEGSWYNKEEIIKDELFNDRNNPEEINVYKNELFKWEDHNDFLGDITPLIKLCNYKSNANSKLSTTNVTKENLEEYFNIYNKTTEAENTENIKIFNLFSFLALPFRYNNTENSEWWINKQNIKHFHEIKDFYPIWVKIKEETLNEQSIIKLLTQIIYSKIVNTDDGNFDYSFSITENDFNISNYNDLNIHNNTKLYYLLLFLNTIDLININKIFNYTDHINFRPIDNNENHLILGNWIIWSRSPRGHYWGNIPLYNCWQVKDRMDNFLYFKKMIPKNEEEIENKIEENTKNHIESLKGFFKKFI